MSAHTSDHGHGNADGVVRADQQHIASLGAYLGIFGLLMVLTAATVGAAQVDMGPFNVVVAVLIACVKATVVVLFFMHVKYSSPLVKLTAACGFIWLIFMFGLVFTDYAGRLMKDPPKAWITPPAVAETAPAAAHE